MIKINIYLYLPGKTNLIKTSKKEKKEIYSKSTPKTNDLK